MSDKTSLGDRMKQYEAVARTALTPRCPMIVRIDGRAFHTFTKPLKDPDAPDPWSLVLREGLTAAATALLREIPGSKLAYLQSDELSVLVTDYDTLGARPWFGKISQKIDSVTASITTAAFNEVMQAWSATRKLGFATFDSRCFVLPKEDVCNYFVWRQQDATRNSVSMIAQHYFEHERLQGLNWGALQELLWTEKNINWDKIETWKKRGWCVRRDTYEGVVGEDSQAPASEVGKTYTRETIVSDLEIPIFTQSRSYIERHVFIGD